KARKIAVDGRTRTGNVINTESAKKWVERDGELWFFCGAVSDREKFIDHFKDPNPKKQEFELEASAIVVRDSKVFYCVIEHDGSPCAAEIDYDDNMGSGGLFAMAALDHGKSVREAVEYAITRDSGSGGKITVFDVERMEFCDD
ncbi:MAG: hypothetical protein KAG70_10535, partial [Alcanivorax sp.]|nr:hypothetical protein [Alcanivorax sp.]